MAGQFDPADLERGASALKDIDSSKHSSWAFELAMMQEKTKQFERLVAVEQQKVQRGMLEQELLSAQAEEMRRTASHIADQERATACHKAEVENSLQNRKLEFQKETLQYQLQREQEQFLQHEAIRIKNEKLFEEAARETMRLRGAFDKDSAIAAAKAEAAGRAQQERENIEIRLRELRARKGEERKTRLEAIEEVLGGVSAGAQALYDDRSKAITLLASLTALALGVYSARAATRVAATVIERNLSRPPLVRETSRWTFVPKLNSLWSGVTRPGIFENIILEETLKERLLWTTNALVSAQENGTPFRHLLLHGPPGTGKTLFARTLARQSGLDYAVMSGGDLGPLGHEGPHELHKLFEWAAKSRRGLILFVDEADAFLRRGRAGEGGMSEDARNALSVFLHHTGTENARIAVILATNVPSVLDRAVLDRIDEAFEFPRPGYEQRLQMLQMFMDRHVHRTASKSKHQGIEVDKEVESEFLVNVAKKTEGFSGRQLVKLVLALQAAVYGSGTQRLTLGLAETVLQWRLTHPNA